MTGETAKHKCKNLRNSYMKYIKYLKGFTGVAKKYQNWAWASLEFLKDIVVPQAATSNVSQINQILHNDEAQEEEHETYSRLVTSLS